jgi:hypothetical protein
LAKAFDPKTLQDYEKFISTQEKVAEVMRKGSLSFAKGMKDAYTAHKRYLQAEEQAVKINEEILKLKEAQKTATAEENQELQKQIGELESVYKSTKKVADENKVLSQALKNQTTSVKNLSIAVGRDLGKAFKKTFSYALSTTKSLISEVKSLGQLYDQQDSTVRRTAVNIGLMGKQQDQFRKTVYKSALATQRLGMDAKDLATTYGSYVDNVGRLIPLTEKAAYALSEMAQGTSLGADGAAQMASSMEVFGMSIEGTAKYVGDVVEMSEKMGVNSGKVLGTLSQNLKKAQTVRFKDGVKGMAKMAAMSTKLRMDMSAALGFAQDLWEPEKAIETAAQLQMMGGSFAKMADPLQLMFLGRNDPAKLMENLANASASVVKNMGDGTYDIPTMELQRLREVAQATGIDFEQLVETAKTSARQKDISRMLNPGMSKEQKEFIASIATYDKSKGFVVTIDGKTKKVAELSSDMVNGMKEQAKTLDERAKSAQGFLTLIGNLLGSLKNLAFSFFAGMEKTLRPFIEKLMGTGKGSLASFSDKMFDLGAKFGTFLSENLLPTIEKLINWGKEFFAKLPGFFTDDKGGFDILGGIGKSMGFIWESLKSSDAFTALIEAIKSIATPLLKPLETMVKILGGIAAAVLAIKATQMISSLTGGLGGRLGGRMLGRGAAGVGRGAAGLGRGAAGVGRGAAGVGRGAAGVGRGAAGVFGRGGGLSLGKSLAGGMRAANPLFLASMGMDIGRSFLDDPNSATGKGLGVGSTIAGDAAMGAMIGSVVPGVGTAIGGVIGGVVGAARGIYNEFSEKILGEYDVNKNIAKKNLKIGGAGVTSMMDGYSKGGTMITTPKGEVFQTHMKDYIMVGQPGSSGGGGGSKNINITGKLSLEGGGFSVDLLKNPIFVREMTKVISKTMIEQSR